MKLKTKAPYFSAVVVFLYTYFLGSLFVGGDQTHYRYVYEAVSQLGLLEAYTQYRSRLYTDEIGHFLIIWLASSFFDKDVFMALCNAALAFFSIKLFMQWGARTSIAVFLVFFGYYFLALYLSAERLKFGALFFVMGVYFYNLYGVKNARKSSVFFLASILSHLQFLIILALFLFKKSLDVVYMAIRRKVVTKNNIIIIVFFLSLSLFAFVFFNQHIVSKIQSYHGDFSIDEYLRIMVFFLLSLYYSRSKFEPIVFFFILFILVGIVGGMRVNMFGYFVFLYYALKVNGGLNFGVVITSLYYLVGWFDYSSDVIHCGVNRPC